MWIVGTLFGEIVLALLLMILLAVVVGFKLLLDLIE